jgi:hypothetical protein
LSNSIIVSIGHKNAEKLRHRIVKRTQPASKTETTAGTVSLEKCGSPFLAFYLNQCHYVNIFSFVLLQTQNNQNKVKHKLMFIYT